MKPEFTSVKILRKDLPRLAKYKIHHNQGFWEVIKKFLDDEEAEIKNEKSN